MFTATADAARIETVEFTAPAAQITARTETDLTEARVEITGPRHEIQGATAHQSGGVWTIRLPRTPAGTGSGFGRRSGGRVTNFVANVSGNGQVIQAGTINGATIVNGAGVGVEDVVFGNSGPVQSGGRTPPQVPVMVTLLLPAGVDLTAEVVNGNVDTFSADLRVLDVHTANAPVLAGRATDVRIRTGDGSVDVRELTGSGEVTTGSGRIEVEGGTYVTLENGIGGIRWTATKDAHISAHTGIGTIEIRRKEFQVTTDLYSGSGRIYES